MVFLHINESRAKIPIFNTFIKRGKPAFVLIYKDGCPPCMEIHPEWKKLENVLKVDKKVIIADINEKFLKDVDCFETEQVEKSDKIVITHYPTMIYIQGPHNKLYEGNRTIDALVKWINRTLRKTYHRPRYGGLTKRKRH